MERLGREWLEQVVAAVAPGARLAGWAPVGAETGAGVARKDAGYGRPVRVDLVDPGGGPRSLVVRTAVANEFGHDRRADRLGELVLAYDTFGAVPDHIRALDVGLVAPDGPRSLRDGGEPYLVTTWAEGRLYADDLRRIAADRAAGPRDLARCEALARWLAALHREPRHDPVAWRRAVRDLVGHGEGIFGIVDAYPDDVPAAPPARLRALEERCLAWRWRLRGRAERLRATHGDFHPFNIVFGEGTRFTLLDASRGGIGDPADDLAALAVNYPFFALQAPGSWDRGLGPLWRTLFATYVQAAGRAVALESLPPFLAWRALVVCCPRFYPGLPAAARDALLGLAEVALAARAFDAAAAEALFR